MAIILLIQLSDWFYGLKHSKGMQKKIKQFYYDTIMVNFCKGCDVHMFFLFFFFRNYRGRSISILKIWPKIKDWVDIWISLNVWSIYSTRIWSSCKCNSSNYLWFSLKAFVIICNAHKLFILYYIMYFTSATATTDRSLATPLATLLKSFFLWPPCSFCPFFLDMKCLY